MTDKDFIYWLQGFFEISEATELSEKQVNIIKAHLHLVLNNDSMKYNEIYDYAPNGDPLTPEQIELLMIGKNPFKVK